ncbi:hypothetical protein C7212DRAFT_317993, partial [Tuber magnatum]
MPTSRRVQVPLSFCSVNSHYPKKADERANPRKPRKQASKPSTPAVAARNPKGKEAVAVDLLVVGMNAYAAEKEASCQCTAQPGRAAIRRKWKP